MTDKSETPNGRRRPSGSVVINRAMYEQLVQERERFRADLAAVTRERDEAKMELKRHFPIGKYDGLDIEQWKDRAERAEAKLAEAEKDARRLADLWKNCRIIYFPKDGAYPIEHNPHAIGYSNDFAMKEIYSAMEAGRG